MELLPMQKKMNYETIIAKDIMSVSPKTVEDDVLAINAYTTMKDNKITSLLVVTDHEYLGVVHIHDILREGIV